MDDPTRINVRNSRWRREAEKWLKDDGHTMLEAQCHILRMQIMTTYLLERVEDSIDGLPGGGRP